MPDVKLPKGVIVVPAAKIVDRNTNPGSVMASADKFIDMSDFASLHVQIDLLSFDRDFTVCGGAAVVARQSTFGSHHGLTPS